MANTPFTDCCGFLLASVTPKCIVFWTRWTEIPGYVMAVAAEHEKSARVKSGLASNGDRDPPILGSSN